MKNRFPLVLDTVDNTTKIKELSANENLLLKNNNIIDVRDIKSVGTIDAKNFTLNGEEFVPDSLINLAKDLSSNPRKYVRVNAAGTGFAFTDQTGAALSEFENDLNFVTAGEVEEIVQDFILDAEFENIKFVNSNQILVISPSTLTQNRTLTLPDSNGTIATREWVGAITSSAEKSYNSVFKCSAEFQSTDFNNGEVSVIKNVEFVNNFRIGDKIKIYGANSTVAQTLNTSNVTFSVSKNGFSDIQEGNGISIFYRIARFNIVTGNISPSTTIERSVIVDSTVEFDENNNVRIFNIQGVDSNSGLLIYKRNGTEGNWNLIAIVGPGNYSSGTYIDYGDSDNNPWSGLDPETNLFLSSNLIHFPTTPPTTFLYGWTDATISFIDYFTKEIRIKEKVFARPGFINISSDDTEYLQNLIQEQVDSGRASLRLSDVTYVVSKLRIPNNFSLIGVSGMTLIYKLPWSAIAPDVNSTAILQATNRIGPQNLSIQDLKIDGNLPNQFLISDIVDKSLNYAINFGTQGSNIKINNIELYNVVGGGIYSTSTSNLTINASKIRNGTISDRFLYSPALIFEANNAVISENIFENFTSAVDISVSRESVVSNNIIKNSGTGLLVYASKNLISSPNVLMGPANELLPSPDILNSVYDSVNVYLEPGLAFTSDQYRYQENGENFNLIADPSNIIIYELWKLEKTAEGFENLYEKINDVSIVNIPAGNNPQQGEFQFRITRSMVNKILQDYNFTVLKDIRSTHVGLVYRAILEENVIAGNIIGTGTVGAGGSQSYPTNTYRVSVTNAKYLSLGSDVKLSGHIGFDVSGSSLVGKVYDLIIQPDNTGIVVIQFLGATNISPGIGGRINIINQFVMAKGRVL
jgi:hypothetical protein